MSLSACEIALLVQHQVVEFRVLRKNPAGDTLALSFGGSRSPNEITTDQMRSFADTARIPASPLWQIAVETAERTVASWKTLEQADLLPKEMRAFIEKQILTVAATTK